MGEGGYHATCALAMRDTGGVPPPALGSLHAPDDLARRHTRHERNALDATAARDDLVAPDDVVLGPVGALHEHVGSERGDEVAGRVVVEEDYVIDGGETREHLGPL